MAGLKAIRSFLKVNTRVPPLSTDSLPFCRTLYKPFKKYSEKSERGQVDSLVCTSMRKPFS